MSLRGIASQNPFHKTPVRRKGGPSFVPSLADDSNKENIPPDALFDAANSGENNDAPQQRPLAATAMPRPAKRLLSHGFSAEPVTPKRRKTSERPALVPRRCAPGNRAVSGDDDGLSSLFATGESASEDPLIEARMRALDSLRLPTPRRPSRAAESAAKQASDTVGTADLPLDLTLRSGARFTSKTPFTWCGGASPADETTALRMFSACRDADSSTPDAVEFRRALHTYVHPAAPWPACLVRLAGKLSAGGERDRTPEERADMEYLQQRRDEWVSALRSAYFSLRAGDCPFFHVRSQVFSAVFTAAGVAGRAEISATVSRSTRGLRMRLVHEDVPFTMPHAPQGAAAPVSAKEPAGGLNDSGFAEGSDDEAEAMDAEEAAIEEDLNDLERMNVQTRVVSGAEGDGGPESMLLFTGHAAVHGLFEFVLNMRHVSGRAAGPQLVPPTIYAPVPFANAAVKAAQIKFNGTVRRSDAGGLTDTAAVESVHTLELSGPLLASSIAALSRLFARSQGGEFALTLKADAVDVASNGPGVGACDGPSDVPMSGYLARASPLGAKTLHQVTCSRGRFTWTVA